ncbi:outer membrane beta-barrel protein [Robertkochia marina]|nr:outer membrane beta-barrel protein [Robertkochia marina]
MFLIIPPAGVYAQKKHEQGYLITKEGDTITGTLKRQTIPESYKACVFVSGNTERTYLPHELNGYGYDQGANFSSQLIDNFFAETLVIGRLNLYRIFDTFYITKDGQLYRLDNIPENTLRNLDKTNGKRKGWRDIVSQLISDCLPEPEKEVESLGYMENHLVELVTKYNTCQGWEYTEYKEDLPWIKFNFGLLTGVNSTSIRNNPEEGDGIVYMDESYTSVNPAFGILASATFPRTTAKRMSLDGELHFSRSSFTTNTLDLVSNATTTLHQEYIRSEIDLTTLSLPVSVKYTIPFNATGLFFQGGLNVEFNIKNDGKQRVERSTSGFYETDRFEVYNTYYEEIAIAGNNYLGPWGGLGLQRNFTQFNAGMTVRYYYLFRMDHNNIATPEFNRITLNLIVQL